MSQLMTLKTVARGAAEEAFAMNLEEVLANIRDPNTPAKKSRSITIEIEFSPNENRSFCDVKVICKKKIQAPLPIETVVMIEKDAKTGKLIAIEQGAGIQPDQHNMLEHPILDVPFGVQGA